MYSVIIPALNEGSHLWYTLHSLQQNWHACDDGCDHELIVVNPNSTDNTDAFLNDSGVRKWVKQVKTTVSGAGPARQVGAKEAKGDVLFFFDAHVLLPPDYFTKALTAMKLIWGKVGVLHCPVKWNWSGDAATHYELTLKTNFWGDNVSGNFGRLTEIGVAGHACIAVRAEHFNHVHGYSIPQTNYGGEETYLNLKMARFGFRNYSLGNSQCLHCSQRKQEYHWDFASLFRNNIMSANAVGGRHWADSILDWQSKSNNWCPPYSELVELHKQGIELSRDDHDFIESWSKMSLDEVLNDWKYRKVPC